jgi:hypothetical protein
MGFMNWTQLGKPKSVSPVKRTRHTGQTSPKPPSWLADKWHKTKRAGETAMTLGSGAALGSMIPFAAGKSTETDIERMKQYRGKELGDRS